MADWPGLVCLLGDWADGTPLLTSHPVRETHRRADLDAAPELPPTGRSLVGGGWFGRLDFDGTARFAWHDHVLRLVDGRWRFEAYWSPNRAAALRDRERAWRAAVETGRPVAESTAGAAVAGQPAAWTVGPFAGPEVADHLAAVERAVELIRAGELYQVNVCTRLVADFAGSPVALFAAAVEALAPRYAAYVDGLVSLSPELFLRRRGRRVRTEPIKGTLPASAAPEALRRSAKDAAENVMIVDLMRNDLGRVCEIGSVRPESLLDVQPHPGVWHLVSAVAGRLRPEVGDAALLAATFPPGSVTGAPKLRALRAIAELEPVPRGAYTGALGFVSPTWGAEFSVVIRTFEVRGGRIELGVGGGITADSVPMLEWRECLHKAAPLLRVAGAQPFAPDDPAPDPALVAAGLLETLLAVDGVPVRLADHLARLERSCRELYGAGLPAELAGQVEQAAKAVPTARAVLRVVVNPERVVQVTAAPAPPGPGPLTVASRVRPAGVWRHKWAARHWAGAPALFVGSDGAVLETERGNVFVVEADGTLVTPPLRADVLPGVTRRALLDLARDTGRRTELRTFSLPELVRRPAFWTSSLSGAVPIHAVDGVDLPRADELVAEFARRLIGGGASDR